MTTLQPQDLFTPNRQNNTIAQRIDATGDCWEWTGATTKDGYGNIQINKKNHYTHRLIYETLTGPIPPKLTLDHLCRNKKCCNPDHLQPTTNKQNLNRGIHANTQKTHCPQGHPYTGKNLKTLYTGARACRTCYNKKANNRYHKNKQTTKQQP